MWNSSAPRHRMYRRQSSIVLQRQQPSASLVWVNESDSDITPLRMIFATRRHPSLSSLVSRVTEGRLTINRSAGFYSVFHDKELNIVNRHYQLNGYLVAKKFLLRSTVSYAPSHEAVTVWDLDMIKHISTLPEGSKSQAAWTNSTAA